MDIDSRTKPCDSSSTDLQPVIYYTGNTWQRPGDAVTLSGSRLGSWTKTVQISRLDDACTCDLPGFPERYFYDRLSDEQEPDFRKPFRFREESAWEGKILQRTEDSVKLILPEDPHQQGNQKEGIYAVKLNGPTPGSEPLYTYLNAPEIHFILARNEFTGSAGMVLHICGTSLAPGAEGQPAHLPRVFLKPVGGSNEDGLLISALEVSDPYSVRVPLPKNLTPGNYRVYLHNGYGGDTAWSGGSAVTIGPDPRESWPKDLFDVRAFGAMGKGTLHNDTPAVIAALRAAEKNGGGIVYFPKGTYTLCFPFTVPERVILKGDGIRKTRIVWLPYLWDFGELPESMIALKGNTEISDIDFSGTRLGPLFTAYPNPENGHAPENISIHNCRTYLTPFTASPTDGIHPRGNGKEPVYLYGEAYKELSSYRNANGSIIFKMTGVTNLAVFDNDLDTEGSAYRFLKCSGVWLAQNKMYGCFEASLGGVTGAVIENNTLDGYCNTISGDGIYCAHNRFVNRDINNREIMTSDGPGHYGASDGNTYLETADETGKRFRLSKPFARNILAGKQLLIQEGPGEGQMRRILANDGYEISVESPFAAPPSDGISKVGIMSARSNSIFYRNYMYNAGDFQFYGTQLNTLVIENTFEKMRGFVARGCNIYNFIQPNWYISVCGNRFLDANYLHNVGYTTDWLKALPKLEIWGGSPAANNQLCTVVRNNRLSDGFFILVKGDGPKSPITDLVLQNNRIEDAEFGIYLTASSRCDGVLFLENQFVNVGKPYMVSEPDQKQKAENELGETRFLFLDSYL